MKIHRFYIESVDVSDLNNKKEIVTQETYIIHQLKNVFRYNIGQIVHIFNERIGEIEVSISHFSKKDMSFTYIRHIKDIKDFDFNKNQNKEITLYMSIIKNSNFDLVVEKVVELGVNKIIPIITDRTIKNNLNYVRLNKIIKEATEQCGRIDLLKIENTIDFKDSIPKALKDGDINYFGFINNKIDVKKIFVNSNKNKIGIFIGPEGGFSDKEIKTFFDNNFLDLALNQNVLRAETAAILACGLLSL